jgi:hypothetical protein
MVITTTMTIVTVAVTVTVAVAVTVAAMLGIRMERADQVAGSQGQDQGQGRVALMGLNPFDEQQTRYAAKTARVAATVVLQPIPGAFQMQAEHNRAVMEAMAMAMTMVIRPAASIAAAVLRMATEWGSASSGPPTHAYLLLSAHG